MAYPPSTLDTDLLNETDAESGVDDAAALEAEGGTPGEGEHAARHNDAAAAINDIVAELGANPSGASASVDARLAALDIVVASKATTTAVTEALAAKASKAELAAEESARISGLAGKAPTAHEHAQYDPYDQLPYVIPMGIAPGTTVGPTAKRGYFNRFTVARKREFKFVRYAIGAVGTGTTDKVFAAIYKVNGAKLERLATSGAVSTNFTAVSIKAPELTTTAVCEPGTVYFVGWSLETVSGTPQLLALLNNNGSVGDMAGTGTLANRLMLWKAEQSPLPETVETFGGSTPTPYLLPSES